MFASLISSLVMLNGCASSPSNTTPRPLHLQQINADGTGTTGAGIIVSIFDTGIAANHPDLAGKVIGGADYISADNPQHLQDSQGHGTHVAGLIAASPSDNNVQGIAYGAQLLSYRMLLNDSDDVGEGYANNQEIALGYRDALTQGSYIYNNSWGTDSTVNDGTTVAQLRSDIFFILSQASTNVEAGGVFIFSGSNDGFSEVSIEAGLPYYFDYLQPGWLAAVALNEAGALASYSNACGLAQAWCLAAPGGEFPGLESLDPNGGTSFRVGTSMAAAVVSGSLTVVLDAFGNANFNAQDAAQRLLTTANKTGIYSDANIYGQGALNLGAALQPIGTLAVPQGTHLTSAQAMPLSVSSLSLPSAAQALIAKQLPEQSILVVDSFQSVPFQAPLQQLMAATTTDVFVDPLSSIHSPNHTLAKQSPAASVGFDILPALHLTMPSAAIDGAVNNRSLKLQWQPTQSPWYGLMTYPLDSLSLSQLSLNSSTSIANQPFIEAGVTLNKGQVYTSYMADNLYHYGINNEGAFHQGSSGVLNHGIRFYHQWLQTGIDSSVSVAQSHWQPEQSESSLWQWQDDQQITTWRLDATHTPRDNSYVSTGIWWQLNHYHGDTAASLRLPYGFQQDGSIVYQTIDLSGESLFNQHSVGAFWQWNNNQNWGLKTQVVVKNTAGSTQSGINIELGSALGRK